MLRTFARTCLAAFALAAFACAGEAPPPGPEAVVDLLSDVQPQDPPRDGEGGNPGDPPVPCENREGEDRCDQPCSDQDGDNRCDEVTCEDGREGDACEPQQPCEDRDGDNYCDYETAPPQTPCENPEGGDDRCEGGGDGNPPAGEPYCGCDMILEMCPGFGSECEGGACARVCDTEGDVCVECRESGECNACSGSGECQSFTCGQWYEACEAACRSITTPPSPGGEGDAPQAPCENPEGGEDRCGEDGAP